MQIDYIVVPQVVPHLLSTLVPCPICGTLYDGQYVYCDKCVAEQEKEHDEGWPYDPMMLFEL